MSIPKTMKALVKAKPEVGLWMEEVPVPEPGPNDLLIKIKKAAICGTDLHIWKWDNWAQHTLKLPLVVGHEFMGEVVGLGSQVAGFALGDRVSGEGHVTCGHCRRCRAGKRHLCRNTVGIGVNRNGAFADYLVLPTPQPHQRSVARWPAWAQGSPAAHQSAQARRSPATPGSLALSSSWARRCR